MSYNQAEGIWQAGFSGEREGRESRFLSTTCLISLYFGLFSHISIEGKLVNSIKNYLVAAVCLAGFAGSALAVAPDFMDKLNADSRPMEDKMRDGARRPYQVMQLLGVEEGMTVVDVGAGGGWYTRVLSAAVGPRGKVLAQFGPRALQQNNGQAQKDMAAELGNVEPVFDNVADMGENVADVAVTALNIHHSNAERGVPYMRDLYRILKPGGVAAIIDHIGLPEINNAQLHRMLQSDARQWIEAAGFEIVEDSNLLRTNADDHTRSVQDPILGRNVDRFLFVVRKPR
jgi:predicted methyltransferase